MSELIPSAARRAEINAIGQLLAGIREAGEDVVSITFSGHAPNVDCPGGFSSVTIKAGREEETSSAVGLVDALYLARAKVNAIRERRKEAEVKAKAASQGIDAGTGATDAGAIGEADESPVVASSDDAPNTNTANSTEGVVK